MLFLEALKFFNFRSSILLFLPSMSYCYISPTTKGWCLRGFLTPGHYTYILVLGVLGPAYSSPYIKFVFILCKIVLYFQHLLSSIRQRRPNLTLHTSRKEKKSFRQEHHGCISGCPWPGSYQCPPQREGYLTDCVVLHTQKEL